MTRVMAVILRKLNMVLTVPGNKPGGRGGSGLTDLC